MGNTFPGWNPTLRRRNVSINHLTGIVTGAAIKRVDRKSISRTTDAADVNVLAYQTYRNIGVSVNNAYSGR